jgi:hypothetical protein
MATLYSNKKVMGSKVVMAGKLRSFVYSILLFAFITGCSKDDEVVPLLPPELSSVEIGTANSKTAYAGQDFHLEASLQSQNPLASLKIQITPVVSGRGWIYSALYTQQVAGLKNAVFHEHLKVPDDALAGDYDLLLLITDQNGLKTEYRSSIKVIKDPSLPSVSGMQVALNSMSALNISGKVKAPNKIAVIKIEVQSSAWTKVFNFDGSDVQGKSELDFKTSLDLSAAPAGHYHINITIVDQLNKRIPLSYHLDK